MHDGNMDSQDKMKFPAMCRQLRVDRGLKQREVADHLGIRTSSYGNVESNNHKTMSIDRVKKLARFYVLDEQETAALIAAWNELPTSDYNDRQAKTWEARKAFRSKARNHDRIRDSLLGVTTLLVTSVADERLLCSCPARDEAQLFAAEDEECELCSALVLLGVDTGFTSRAEIVDRLAALQESSSSEASS